MPREAFQTPSGGAPRVLIARCDIALVGGAAVTGWWALGWVDGGWSGRYSR